MSIKEPLTGIVPVQEGRPVDQRFELLAQNLLDWSTKGGSDGSFPFGSLKPNGAIDDAGVFYPATNEKVSARRVDLEVDLGRFFGDGFVLPEGGSVFVVYTEQVSSEDGRSTLTPTGHHAYIACDGEGAVFSAARTNDARNPQRNLVEFTVTDAPNTVEESALRACILQREILRRLPSFMEAKEMSSLEELRAEVASTLADPSPGGIPPALRMPSLSDQSPTVLYDILTSVPNQYAGLTCDSLRALYPE